MHRMNRTILINGLFALILYSMTTYAYYAGIHRGKKEMVDKYSAKITQLEKATYPEHIKEWLRSRGK